MRPPRSEGWLSRSLPTKAPPRCCRLECEVAEAWAGEQLSWARRDEAGAETLLTAGARLLTSEAGVSVEAVPGSATLTVARVWLQQEGEYRCYRGNIAHNNYIQHTLEISGGSSGTHNTLTSPPPDLYPTFKTSPTVYYVRENETAREVDL